MRNILHTHQAIVHKCLSMAGKGQAANVHIMGRANDANKKGIRL